jgi:hypothetical protein
MNLTAGTPIVMNENTLGIALNENSVQVLAGSVLKGGPDPLKGPVPFNPRIDQARPANAADFEQYRVSPAGHLYPV